MSEKRDLSELTDEELERELARRKAANRLELDSYSFEVELEGDARREGALGMQGYLDERSAGQTTEKKPCPKCGKPSRVRRRDVRRKVRSRHGEHVFRRHHHYCESCKAGFYPLDTELGLPPDGEVTGRLEQLILDLGLHGPFEEAAERFELHHGQSISENLVRRVVERVGLAAVGQEDLASRLKPAADAVPETLVVQVDGSMVSTRGKDAWREVKVGAVVRGEHLVRNGRRGLITEARFVARLGSYEGFKRELTAALSLERAWECPNVIVVGDGAPWVWAIADEVCHGALQILDYPHAVEHAHDAAKAIFGDASGLDRVFVHTIEHMLWAGRIDDIVHELEQCAFGTRGKVRAALVDLIRYYRGNASRMRYDLYRLRGLPCGSGAIESAHRHVLQKRMKLAGQHWAPERADRLASLRAALATTGPKKLHAAVRAEMRPTGSYG